MPLTLTCPECHRKLKVPETAAGKKVRCPECQAAFRAEAEEGVADRPAPRPVRGRDERDDDDRRERRPRLRDDDDRGERRRPERKKGGLVLGLVLGGAGLLVVAGAVVAAVFLFGRGRIGEGEWKEFTPPDNSFTVLMPGTPTSSMQSVGAFTLTKHTVTHKGSDTFFVAASFDVPNDAPADILTTCYQAERKHLTSVVKGKVTREVEYSHGVYHGHEFAITAEDKKGKAIERMFLAETPTGRRLYVLVVGGPGIEPGKGDAAKFFDSIKLRSGDMDDLIAAQGISEGAETVTNGDPARGELYTLRPGPEGVFRLALSPDGKTLVTGAAGCIRLSDAATGKRRASFETERDVTQALVFSPDSEYLVNAGRGRNVRRGDGSLVVGGGLGGTTDLAFSPDGKRFVTANGRRSLATSTRPPWVDSDPPVIVEPTITGLSFAPDSQRVVIGVGKYGVEIVDVVSGQRLRHPVRAQLVRAVAFLADNETVAAAWGSEVSLLRARDGAEAGNLSGGKDGTIRRLALSADGTKLAAATDWGRVRIWDIKARKPLADLPHEGAGLDVAFSRDGTRLASAAAGTVKMWDLPKAIEANPPK